MKRKEMVSRLMALDQKVHEQSISSERHDDVIGSHGKALHELSRNGIRHAAACPGCGSVQLTRNMVAVGYEPRMTFAHTEWREVLFCNTCSSVPELIVMHTLKPLDIPDQLSDEFLAVLRAADALRVINENSKEQ